jgi:hypothetical protein
VTCGIGRSPQATCVFEVSPAEHKLPPPIGHGLIREDFIPITVDQFSMGFEGRKAVIGRKFDEHSLPQFGASRHGRGERVRLEASPVVMPIFFGHPVFVVDNSLDTNVQFIDGSASKDVSISSTMCRK